MSIRKVGLQQLNDVLDRVAEIRKEWHHSLSLGRAGALSERYRNGVLVIHLHVRWHGSDWRFVYEWAGGIVSLSDAGEIVRSMARRDEAVPLEFEFRQSDETVLVSVVELAENVKGFRSRITPSMIGLQTLDDCLSVRGKPGNHGEPLVHVFSDVPEDWELSTPPALPRCERIDDVIERGPQVLDAISDDQAIGNPQFDRAVVRDAILARLTVKLWDRPKASGLMVVAQPPLQLIEMMMGPLELGPVAVYRGSGVVHG